MKRLLQSIKNLKNSKVKNLVDTRLREFKEIGNGSSNTIFKELCFCILTANFNAERSMKIQRQIGDEFLTISKSDLARKLRELGHRFPDTRARYVVDARKYKNLLKDIVKTFNDGNELREWIVKNVKGIGYKEASHFLRNIGYTSFAIIDFHIIDVLTKHNIIEKPNVLTKRKYLEIEDLLGKIARKSNVNLAELDLYLWYMETGKILK
ncbi:MAG: N-glycosylase/DNA lyase [Candidatus Bathyarchaeota archaeon]|nr:N-glycosylase/DNA lyase [Candidatus Bathyarchaeota archaeon]